ncbi:MAG TPA: hypothetical protein DEQ43_21285 [Nocardioides bacterium]|nr:hypothetical protein [Nocardioides sp.]
MDDAAWLAEPPKRSRLRLVLVVLLVTAVVFLAGVQVQKRWGVAGTDAAAAAGGLPAGFTPPSDGGGFPRLDTGQGSGDTGATDAPAAETDSDAAAVIGTLVSVKDGVWTVEDLGGTEHTITVGNDVQIVQESTLTADQVASGSTVDISGTTDDQGRVTATTITIR